MMMWEVVESSRRVAEESVHVTIHPPALAPLVSQLASGILRVPPWDSRYHFVDGGPDTVAYLLVLDSLNFCFWAPRGKSPWTIRYDREQLSGYYALAGALTRGLESGAPLLDAPYLAEMSLSDLKTIFQGEGELQLLEERLRVLQELGKVLRDRYGGKAHRMVESASGSAVGLTRLLAEELPSFRDAGQYRGRKVFFYKRAQILAADLHGAFSGESWGRFRDLDQLTAFADYKLPQVLRHLGILRYSPALAEQVDRHELILAGSPEEIEIRANTICAVERIRQELHSDRVKLAPFELDRILWNMGQEDRFREKPYHRTATIFY
jgi:hypothetical protein